MDIDTSQWPPTYQWPQGIGAAIAAGENSTENYEKPTVNITRPPQKDHQRVAAALNCPRCNSNNTKFCYYNNYSLSQPRYLCKTCKRYWTEGGILRNVPVGGGSRKHKRPSSSTKKVISNLSQPIISPDHQNPKPHDGQTLNLDFDPSEFGGLPVGLNFDDSLKDLCSSSFSHDLPVDSLISMPVPNSNSVSSSSSFDNYTYDFKPTSSNLTLDVIERWLCE